MAPESLRPTVGTGRLEQVAEIMRIVSTLTLPLPYLGGKQIYDNRLWLIHSDLSLQTDQRKRSLLPT